MADIIVDMSLQADGSQVSAQVKIIQQQVKDTKTALESLSTVFEDVKKGFSAITSAMELFGIEGEGVEKALKKVSAALEISEGLESISKLSKDFTKAGEAIKSSTALKVLDKAATEAATAVQEAFGIAVDTTAASFQALKVAMALTGVGLLIVGIVALVSALNSASKEAEEAKKKQEEYDDVMKDAAGGYKDAYTQIAKLKQEFEAAGTNTYKQKKALEDFNVTVGDSTKQIKTFAEGQAFLADPNQTTAYIDAMYARATATAAIGKAADENLKIQQAGLKIQQLTSDAANAAANATPGWVATFDEHGFSTGIRKETIDEAQDRVMRPFKRQIDEQYKLIVDTQNGINNLLKISNIQSKISNDINKRYGFGLGTKDELDDVVANKKKAFDKGLQNQLDNLQQQQDAAKNEAERQGADEDTKTNIQILGQQERIRILKEYVKNAKGVNNDYYENALSLERQAERDLSKMQDNFRTQQAKETKTNLEKAQQQLAKQETAVLVSPRQQSIGLDNTLKPIDPKTDTATTHLREQIEQEQKDRKAILDLNKGTLNAQLEQQGEFYKKKKALAKADSQESHALDVWNMNQKLQITAGVLGQLTDLFGKQTAAGKATAIAEATINTYLAASKALTGIPKGNPFGAAIAIAQAAIIIATGIKNIKAIVSTKVPGDGGGGSAPSVDTSAPAAPLSPTPVQTGTNLNQDQINQIGNAAANKTYVLDSDIQNNRERDARLNRAARLGG